MSRRSRPNRTGDDEDDSLHQTCRLCRLPDNDRMVSCDECQNWFHYECVGVDDDIANHDWSCQGCLQARNPIQPPVRSTLPATVEPLTATAESIPVDAVLAESQVPNPRLQTSRSPTPRPLPPRSIPLQPPVYSRNVSVDPDLVNKLPVELRIKLLEEEEALERKFLLRRYQILLESSNSGKPTEVRCPNANPTTHEASVLPPTFHSSPLASQRRDVPAFLPPQASHNVPTFQPMGTEQYPNFPMFTQSQGYQRPNVSAIPSLGNMRPNAPEYYPYDFAPDDPTAIGGTTLLNRSQMAARHAVAKDLPIFSGEPEEWPLFFATFENTTNLCGFTPEENMARLQRCLKGKALEAVKCQLLHPSNLEQVLATLKMLFGRPEIIVHSLMQKINALPAPKAERLGTLVDFALAVRNMVATVKACKLKEYLCNLTLLHSLTERLPPMIRLNWATHRQSLAVVTLSEFSDWLYRLAEAASAITLPQFPITVDSKSHKSRKDDGYLNAHCETSPSSEREPSNEIHHQECCICGGPCDSAEKCKEFLGSDLSSRWTILREQKLCRRCLKKHRGPCRISASCGVDDCQYKHHRLLHNHSQKVSNDSKSMVVTLPSKPSSATPPNVTPSSGEHNCNTHRSSSKSVLFRYVPVVLHGRGTKVNTYAFLDDGSSLTLLEDNLASELNLEGVFHPLCLQWTGDTCRYEDSSRKLSVDISSIRNSEKKLKLADVHTVKQLKLPPQTLDFDKLVQQHSYLKGLPVDSYEDVRPRILIGINNWRVGHVLESREGTESDPIASKTRLGWIVYGTCGGGSQIAVNYHSFHICRGSGLTDDDLHRTVKEYFALDSLGIAKHDKAILSGEEERAISMMRSLTSLEGERYRTGLLWKYDGVRLPNSEWMALKRFDCLRRRMQREPQLAEALYGKMDDYINKGYIRKLSSEELNEGHDRVWYLPIFPVFNPNKPGKLRIVWDAAAIANGISLNDVLMKGPDQVTELPAVLYKFREHLVAIGGDIREMFLQVLMNLEDQHCLRFYWSNEDAHGTPDVYVLQVMPFGTTCSPSCAQFVKNENAERFRKQFPKAVEIIKKGHYVDDMLTSVETKEEAIEVAKQVHKIHSKAGFEIRNWVSNSPTVLEALGVEQVAEKNLDVAIETANEKVLGMWWSTQLDTFTYKAFTKRNEDILLRGKRPTKRELLRFMMTIFDPLGLIANYIMFLKVLLQDVWRSGISWDEDIADKEWAKWQHWLQFLPKLETLEIPRCYRFITTNRPTNNIQLHTFVDASEDGFAAVCYFRFEEKGLVECALVGAKSRVAPLKFVSTPRLELQAAVVGARLATNVQENHSYTISKRCFWSDARDVLCWLKSDHRRYSPFVAFRISELLESTELSEWRYVPSGLNIADEATKWRRDPSLNYETRWFQGPEFLWKQETEWPESIPLGATDKELRPNLLHHSVPNEWIIIPENYSRWRFLQRVTAYVLRFPKNIRKKTASQDPKTGPLTSTELKESENYLYRRAQEDVYWEERTLLANMQQSGRRNLPKSSSLFCVEPFIDDVGVMRMQGRISACEFIDETTKHPIILPRQHPVTLLVVRQVHEDHHHQCHQTVLNEVRRQFYIPRVRDVLRRVRRNCPICKNLLAKPQPPIMADLPKSRLAAFVKPFSYMGIDYFGPMQVLIYIILLVSLVRAASKYYDGPIRPYEFGFNIEGHQHRKESKDINGIVMGEFGFITADNVYHVTVYATDENGNFKIVSMKNYKLGPTAPPPTTSAPTTTTTATTTTTTSTTPQPFRIITTAKPLTTAKPSGFAACSGCKIPETTTTTTTTEPALPETSTQYVPPFKIVNKNDIESATMPSTPKPVITTASPSANGKPKSDPEETPQKLVDKQPDSKAPSSKESTKPSQSPGGMQTFSKIPSSQSLQPPRTNESGKTSNAGSDQTTNLKPSKSSPTTPSSSSNGKFDHINTANMMIQHILNGLLYRFNYTVGYHGHHEQGDRNGNKEGGYYAVGRDGIRRGVTYKANEFGFQPHIKFEKVSPEETPREETEKQAGLKGFDFKWFWGESR